MAPPLTLVFSQSAPVSRSQAPMTVANASLTSNRSMSSMVIPALSSTLCVAGIGPVSIVTGSTPARANALKRARGFSPSSSAFSRLMISTAAAPSVICDELPAVTMPSGLNAGFSPASTSGVVVGRMPSSRRMISTEPSSFLTSIGMISFSKRPSSVARAARACESAAYWSISSRVMSHFSAIISAEMPCGTMPWS